ncbi:hypothetical protein D3C85_1816130 [compost metagenome]
MGSLRKIGAASLQVTDEVVAAYVSGGNAFFSADGDHEMGVVLTNTTPQLQHFAYRGLHGGCRNVVGKIAINGGIDRFEQPV